MHPRIEPFGIAQAWQLSPRLEQGLLHCILGKVNVAKDQPGDAEESVDASTGKRLEGAVVATLCRLDQGSRHPPTPPCADRPGRVCHL